MKNTENLDFVFGILVLLVVGLSAFLLLCGPCPNCHCLVGMRDYCPVCGYEIFPHCIECGKVCETAFCKLCGAEQ